MSYCDKTVKLVSRPHMHMTTVSLTVRQLLMSMSDLRRLAALPLCHISGPRRATSRLISNLEIVTLIRLALYLVAFINGYYASVAIGILFGSGAYAHAATEFAVRIGIGAAVLAIAGRGQIAQSVGVLAGATTWV